MPRKNTVLQNRAREMRQNPTDAERRLWSKLRRQQIGGARFRRQQVIGPYIVDFFCPEQRLVIEVDGETHRHNEKYDAQRTAWLEAEGYQVVRVTNDQVRHQIEGVVKVVEKIIDEER